MIMLDYLKQNSLKWDLLMQKVILAINTILLVLIPTGFAVFMLLFFQIAVGFYQLIISQGVHLFVNKSRDGGIVLLRVLHFVFSWFFLAGIFFTPMLMSEMNIYLPDTWSIVMICIFYLIIPQLLAYGYFWLSIKDRKTRYITGRFCLVVD